ncbi:MAG: hypothetical protein ACP5TL_02610 [Candidatus Micrarchaeia archaeon]
MSIIEIDAHVEPTTLKAYSKNEAILKVNFKNADGERHLWCESEVHVENPLSLAPDRNLQAGKTRIGILHPKSSIEKQVRVYTLPNNFPDDYKYNIITYVYDEEGAIVERVEYSNTVKCVDGKDI